MTLFAAAVYSDAFILRKRHCFWQDVKCKKKNRDIPSVIKKSTHIFRPVYIYYIYQYVYKNYCYKKIMQ